MEQHKTSVFENGLIWFGAGVSIAEILSGTYFATLGFSKGLLAILVGHVIGCAMFFLAGLIGGLTRKSSMETTKRSFGYRGGLFFAFLNALQLVAWTAIMIYDGALSASSVFDIGHWFWCVAIGLLVIIWIAVGVTNLAKLNTVTMALLFLLTVVLCKIIFSSGNLGDAPVDDSLSFGAAVELAVAMPLSWLPVISDYTREAEKPVAATAASTVVYGLVSCWMYLIGMGGAIIMGTGDIALIMVRAGLGIAGLLIIVLSTSTTTFLDAYSAGVSMESISPKFRGRTLGIIATVIGIVAACLFPMDDITGFLYLIGSVFAPMIAIMIADFFFLKRDHSGEAFSATNLIVWLIGFLLYRYLMTVDLILGNTLPTMLITMILAILAAKLTSGKEKDA